MFTCQELPRKKEEFNSQRDTNPWPCVQDVVCSTNWATTTTATWLRDLHPAFVFRIFEARNELEKAEQGFMFCIETQVRTQTSGFILTKLRLWAIELLNPSCTFISFSQTIQPN